MVDLVRMANLARVALSALRELVGALEEMAGGTNSGAAPAPAKPEPKRILGWATADREDLLKRWYPTYAPSSMIFRAIREMDGIDPGADSNMQTYAIARLKLRRPADLRRNNDATARDGKELSRAMGWGDVIKMAPPAPAPAPARAAVPAAVRPVAGDWPAAPAAPGSAIWHSWANIKELARRDGWPLEEREQLPMYNKNRERRNLPPLYIKTIPPKGGFNGT